MAEVLDTTGRIKEHLARPPTQRKKGIHMTPIQILILIAWCALGTAAVYYTKFYAPRKWQEQQQERRRGEAREALAELSSSTRRRSFLIGIRNSKIAELNQARSQRSEGEYLSESEIAKAKSDVEAFKVQIREINKIIDGGPLDQKTLKLILPKVEHSELLTEGDLAEILAGDHSVNSVVSDT